MKLVGCIIVPRAKKKRKNRNKLFISFRATEINNCNHVVFELSSVTSVITVFTIIYKWLLNSIEPVRLVKFAVLEVSTLFSSVAAVWIFIFHVLRTDCFHARSC